MKLKRPVHAAALVLSSGGMLWWGWRVANPAPPPGGVMPPALEISSRWDPLFDSRVALPVRLQLAASVDGSFSLPVLGSWATALGTSDAGQEAEADFVIYNEILDQSCRRGLFPASLGRFLITGVQSTGLDPVFRDYAVQHLAHWISPYQSGQPCEPDLALRREAVAVLTHLATDPGVRIGPLPGTALMALAEFEAHHTADLSSHWPVLDRAIAEMIGDGAISHTLRLAALQAAARARRTGHLPLIRRFVAAPTGHPALLMAAVAALGKLGGAEDIPGLTALVESDSTVSAAAQAALKSLAIKIP